VAVWFSYCPPDILLQVVIQRSDLNGSIQSGESKMPDFVSSWQGAVLRLRETGLRKDTRYFVYKERILIFTYVIGISLLRSLSIIFLQVKFSVPHHYRHRIIQKSGQNLLDRSESFSDQDIAGG